MCMTTGPTQYLYISHSGDPGRDGGCGDLQGRAGWEDRRQVRFGRRLPKQFGLANSIDCRNENELLVGEMANWRVQKVSLKR